jgi:hypothetical protein
MGSLAAFLISEAQGIALLANRTQAHTCLICCERILLCGHAWCPEKGEEGSLTLPNATRFDTFSTHLMRCSMKKTPYIYCLVGKRH